MYDFKAGDASVIQHLLYSPCSFFAKILFAYPLVLKLIVTIIIKNIGNILNSQYCDYKTIVSHKPVMLNAFTITDLFL